MLALLIFSANSGSGQSVLFGFLFILLALVPFFYSFEHHHPMARDLVPVAVLAAVAALGRVLFAALPNIKPSSAIIIVAGLAFGPQAGFMTGAVSALASNFFFGQGPWTPWQMFAWGLMGFCSGLLSKSRLRESRLFLCIYGFLFSFLFGWIMDLYQVIMYVNPITPAGILVTFAASLYFDLIHAVSTVIFLLCIAKPWLKYLDRIKTKYGLSGSN